MVLLKKIKQTQKQISSSFRGGDQNQEINRLDPLK